MRKYLPYLYGAAGALIILRGMARGGFGAKGSQWFGDIFVKTTSNGTQDQ